MTGEVFALNTDKGMYFGRNNLTDSYAAGLMTNSEPFHKRDSEPSRGRYKVTA